MFRIVGYALVGALIGFMSGLFGVGGSSIGTPILKMAFGLPDLIALASPLPVTIPTAISGAFSYWRRGLVRRDVLLWAVAGGLPGVVAGALGTKVVTGPWLMILTGVFVLLVGVRLMIGTGSSNAKSAPSNTKLLAGLIGLVVGIFSGLLANGGGFLLVPAFVLLLGLSMQEAAATSLVCVACYAIPGTLVHWWLGHIDWILVLALSAGVIPFGFLGARVGLAVKGDRVRLAFGTFLTIFGADFILLQTGLARRLSYLLLAADIVMAIVWVTTGIMSPRSHGESAGHQPLKTEDRTEQDKEPH